MKNLLLSSFLLLSGSLWSQCNMQNSWVGLEKEPFAYLNAYKKMPKNIRNSLDSLAEGRFAFAQKSIFKLKFDEPKRVLAFIAMSKLGYIVHYEHTGRGVHTHTLIVAYQNGMITGLCNYATPKFDSVEHLIGYLSENLDTLYPIDDF